MLNFHFSEVKYLLFLTAIFITLSFSAAALENNPTLVSLSLGSYQSFTFSQNELKVLKYANTRLKDKLELQVTLDLSSAEQIRY